MSDPKGETPHPDHKPEDEFELEFLPEPEHAAPLGLTHGEEHAAPRNRIPWTP